MSVMKRPVPKQTAQFLKRVFVASGRRHLILTGSRQIGKTTLLGELLGDEILPGLRSKAIFCEQSHPDRVELKDITTGKTAVVGRYESDAMQVQPQGFEVFGVQCLQAAAKAPDTWVQLDELGFLERDCAAFTNAVMALFEQKRVLAVLRKQPGIPLNEAILARPDVFVFDLDALTPPDGLQLGCAILAAGTAQRFGANKLLADFHGVPLVERALLRLPPRLWGNTLVVTRHKEVADLAALYGVQAVNPNGVQLSDSIRCVVNSLAPLDGVLFSVGDQPLCRTKSIQLMLEDFSTHSQSIIRLAFQERQGNPVLFPGSLMEELKELTGEEGGGKVVRRHPKALRSVQAAFAEELEDADTPQKLAALLHFEKAQA